MKRAPAFRSLLGGVVSLLLTLLLLEGALRLLAAHSDDFRLLLYQSNAARTYDDATTLPDLIRRTPYGYRPYSTFAGFVLNSRSLRTPEYAAEKRSEVFRIVVLGDSFAFASGGAPFRDLWHTRLGLELERRWGREVEVINLALPAVGPRFYLRMWQLEGRRLDPDLVLVGFFVGNDFWDDVAPVEGMLARRGVGDRIAGVSHVARMVRNLIRLRGAVTADAAPSVVDDPAAGSQRGGYEIESFRDRYDPMKPTFREEQFLAMETRRASISREDRESDFRQLFRHASATLKRLADEVERSAAEMLVFVIPDSFQVEEELFAAVLWETGSRREDYDLGRPQRALAEFFEASGIEYVDVLAPFRNASRSQRLYRLRDSHWNPEGNRLAADLLIDRLAPGQR